jgi:uncharacterized membrane protein YccF (DUF307 family)
MSISIIGIPWARGCFVIAKFSFCPFGRELIKRDELTGRSDVGTGALGIIGNIIWIVLFGWWLAIVHLLAAAGCAVTIIGIPFALQHAKLAAVSFAPIGKSVVKKHLAEAALMQNAQAELRGIRREQPAVSERVQPALREREAMLTEPVFQLSANTSPPPMPAPPKFTVARGEQKVGEFTEAEIKQHLSTGLLAQSDWFWNEEAKDWQPLTELAHMKGDI